MTNQKLSNKSWMKWLTFSLICLMSATAINADATVKKKRKKTHHQKNAAHAKKTIIKPEHELSLGYPTINGAFDAIRVKQGVRLKANARPFGWQERTGPWYVANEGEYEEWAFTQPGHYAHPSLVKRMIDVGSNNHVDVDMVYRCGAKNVLDCDKLFNEFKEVNLLIKKVYQVKYIQGDDGQATWTGVSILE
jgi:hypothetical protein